MIESSSFLGIIQSVHIRAVIDGRLAKIDEKMKCCLLSLSVDICRETDSTDTLTVGLL